MQTVLKALMIATVPQLQGFTITNQHVACSEAVIGPIPLGHSGPLCHALSLLLSSWTSHAACTIAIAGMRLATPGEWQCNGGSQ